MIWNYRIIIHDTGTSRFAAVHEVFYDDTGVIESWTADPITVDGENVAEIMGMLAHFENDLKQPALKLSALEASLPANK